MVSGSAQASDNANAKVRRLQKQQHKEMASLRTPMWILVANGYFVEDTLIGTGNCLYYFSGVQVSEQGRLT